MRHVAIVVIAASALVSGCASTSNSAAPERDEGGVVIEAGRENILRLRLGDCIDIATRNGIVDEVPVVPCSESHVNQVVAVFDLSGDEYPGESAVRRLADQGCIDELVVALAHREDLVDIGYSMYTPTEELWNELGSREVLCIAGFTGRYNTTDLLDTSVTSDADN